MILRGHTLCIDPGSKESGFVLVRDMDNKIIDFGKVVNYLIFLLPPAERVLIEKFDSVHGKIGHDVVTAIFESGRFWNHFSEAGCPFIFHVGRSQAKKELQVKDDKEAIALIKIVFPSIKLKRDAWQAFLLYVFYNKQKLCPKTSLL
jgi:hypothetical protein